MPITSPFVAYVGNTGYDLRKVQSYVPDQDPTMVQVRFQDSPETVVTVTKESFELAYAAALTAEGG